MVDIETTLISLALGGIGGALVSYLLRRYEKTHEEQARVNNLRELLYTEINRNYGRLYSIDLKIEADLTNYNLQQKFKDEGFVQAKLNDYLRRLQNFSRFDAYNYAKSHPDVFYRLERRKCTNLEDIYECYSSLPGNLKRKLEEQSVANHIAGRDYITYLSWFLRVAIYGAPDRQTSIKSLIKEGLDKDLFEKVTKQSDQRMLISIFAPSS